MWFAPKAKRKKRQEGKREEKNRKCATHCSGSPSPSLSHTHTHSLSHPLFLSFFLSPSFNVHASSSSKKRRFFAWASTRSLSSLSNSLFGLEAMRKLRVSSEMMRPVSSMARRHRSAAFGSLQLSMAWTGFPEHILRCSANRKACALPYTSSKAFSCGLCRTAASVSSIFAWSNACSCLFFSRPNSDEWRADMLRFQHQTPNTDRCQVRGPNHEVAESKERKKEESTTARWLGRRRCEAQL